MVLSACMSYPIDKTLVIIYNYLRIVAVDQKPMLSKFLSVKSGRWFSPCPLPSPCCPGHWIPITIDSYKRGPETKGYRNFYLEPFFDLKISGSNKDIFENEAPIASRGFFISKYLIYFLHLREI